VLLLWADLGLFHDRIESGDLSEKALAITLSGKCERRHQGDRSGRGTVDERAAKHARRNGPEAVSTPFVKLRQG
jgi:hypothetical protein